MTDDWTDPAFVTGAVHAQLEDLSDADKIAVICDVAAQVTGGFVLRSSEHSVDRHIAQFLESYTIEVDGALMWCLGIDPDEDEEDDGFVSIAGFLYDPETGEETDERVSKRLIDVHTITIY